MRPLSPPSGLVLLSARKKPRTGLRLGLGLLLLILSCAGVLLISRLGSFVDAQTASDVESLVPTVIYQVIDPAQPARAKPDSSNKTAGRIASTPGAAPLAVSIGSVNGVALSRIVVLTEASRQRLREIYTQGQKQGRNPRAFSKVGDSTMVYPPFLAPFDTPISYKLGAYAYLQRTIARYAGSFGRESVAVKKGMHTWTEFDPAWVNGDHCQANETPLACEIRLNNPSIALIRLGANDVGEPQDFVLELRKILDFCISRGVIPVLGTKPDRQEGPANTINKLVSQTATSYRIPLWDYDLVAGTVPGRGLESDNVHMRGGGTHDYGSGAAFQDGDSLEDLTALLILDAINRELTAALSQ